MKRWAWIAAVVLVFVPLSACVPEDAGSPPPAPQVSGPPLPTLPISGGPDTLGKFTWYDADDNPLAAGGSDEIRDDYCWRYDYFHVYPKGGTDWTTAEWFEVQLSVGGGVGKFKIWGTGGVFRWIGIEGGHLSLCDVESDCLNSGLPDLPGQVEKMTARYHDGSDWVEGEVTKVRMKNIPPN